MEEKFVFRHLTLTYLAKSDVHSNLAKREGTRKLLCRGEALNNHR